MALIVADRVQELTTTSGTGTLTLNGAVSGFQTFSNGIGNTNTTYYTIYDSTAYVWEVGIGTVGAGTLSRDTVLANSLGTTAKINLAGNQASVFCTYPADKSVNLDASGNVTPLGTISSGTWQGTTVGVAYGGTGVTSSSGANSVVLRDSNQNITVNRINQSNTTTTAAGGTTALTAASSYSQTLVGTGNQTYTMPDATTLTTGVDFVFNNNATGTLTIRDAASGLLGTVSAGGACAIMLLDNGTVAGTWNLHGFLPENVTWGTNALDLGTTIVSNGTWQGGTIQSGYGGTGLTTFVAANNALYSTSASALTAGTLPVAAGGTGQTTYTNGQLLIGNTTGNTLTKATLTQGTGISITNGSGSITVTNSAPDQTVVLTAGTGISTSGTYPNFTITNSAPDQVVALTAGSNITITGTYPSFTIAASGGSGTVTSITAGTGLTGGTITTSGTIAIDSTVVTLTGSQTLTNKTLTNPTMSGPTFNDGYTEEVFAITDSVAVAISPNNGSIQTWTLGANRTPSAAVWAAGQSITLMIDDGSAFTVTWTTLNVIWETDAGSAPTLATTGFTTIVLWKVGTQIYGARVGNN